MIYVKKPWRHSPLFVALGGKEDVKIIRVLMYIEKDGLDVAAILTDTLDSTSRELPFVYLFVFFGCHMPDPNRLK